MRSNAGTAAGVRHIPGADAWLVVLTLAVGAVIVVARRPDAVTNPQFWAEDGKFWFAGAYNIGPAAFLQSVEGYLLTLPRLVAAPVTGLSLGHAALAFNLAGIAVQVAPAGLLMSRRFDDLVPRRWVRTVLAVAYLLLPSFELNITLTNAQWHLALLALLVVVARPPRSRVAHAFDVVVLLLCGLTGPFAVILLPGTIAMAVVRRGNRTWYGLLSALLVATTLVQGVAASLGHRDPVAPLGVTFANAVGLIADRVVLAGLFGEEGHAHVFTTGTTNGVALAAVVSAAAAGLVAFALIRGSAALRVFLLTCFAVTVLSLLSPIATTPGVTAWASLADSSDGARYFFLAELAWLATLAWAISRIRGGAIRTVATVAVTATFLSGLIAAWSYPPYRDLHPALYTASLRAASPGTRVVVPLNPGPPWQMVLVRH